MHRTRDPYSAGDFLAGAAAGRLANGFLASRHREPAESSLDQLACACGWLWRHRLLTTTVTVVAIVWLSVGPLGLVALAVIVGAALAAVWRFWPTGWARLVDWGRRLWRRRTLYEPLWRQVMILSRLATRLDGTEQLPAIHTMRSNRWVDKMIVELVPGIPTEACEAAAANLAEGFAARSCRVTPVAGSPGFVHLTFRRNDPLADAFTLPAPAGIEDVDLDGIPIALAEDGHYFRVPLVGGSHLLIAGETEAGKGSYVWSIVKGAAPAIGAGLVEVWGVDPKLMELAAGQTLMARYARPQRDPETGLATNAAMVELLEDAVRLMVTRAERLAAQGLRVHTPTPDDPAVVVLIDELAVITKYMDDEGQRLRARANAAISMLLAEGRAPGISVIANLQDPRKDTVPQRDLFRRRIALRTAEAETVDLILGKGARARGAACERIPDKPNGGAGIGYVTTATQPEPLRIRAGWVSDDDIAATADRYGTRRLAAVPPLDPEPTDADTDADTGAA